MGRNTPSESHIFLSGNNIFSLKPVASSMWWSRALLGKVNVEVNINTRHVTYHMTSILKVTILHLWRDKRLRKSLVTSDIGSFCWVLDIDKLILLSKEVDQRIDIKALLNIRFWSYYKEEKIKKIKKHDFFK